MSISSPQRSLSGRSGRASCGRGSRRLAESATRRPQRVLAVRGMVVPVSNTVFGAAGAVLFTPLSGVLLARLTREDDHKEKAAS